MMYVSTIVLFVVCTALRSTYSVPAPVDTSFMKDYDKKVCNNEPTCNLTNSPGLLPNRLTLEKRDCMCDFECVQYNDCCKDSQYFNSPTLETSHKEYICPSEHKAYLLKSCAPDFTDEVVKQKCAKAQKPLDETDFALILPVTNTEKRITYANAYCALCNKDDNFELWTLKAGCGEAPVGYLNSASAAKSVPENKISASETPATSASSTAAPAVASSTSDKNVKLNVHFNPGAIFGGNKNADAGINKQLSIPTFGLSTKTLNKTIGSQTGIFGAKIGRSKRQVSRDDLQLDFTKYARKVNEILKTVKYDPNVQDLIGNYEGKDFICRLNASAPDSLSKYLRRCVPNLIDECPNDPEATKLCRSYTQIVYKPADKIAYKNRDCAHCNGITDAELTGCPQEVRGGASGLFSASGKGNANNAACSNPKLADKFC